MEPSLIKAILESKVESLPVLAVDMFVEPALKKLVADSSNPIDDAIFAMVYPPLKVELEKMLAEALEKLKA
jgi:hypothetical protein